MVNQLQLRVPQAEDEVLFSAQNTCIICMESPDIQNALVPCGHSDFCMECAKQFTACPLCNGEINDIVKIYHSQEPKKKKPSVIVQNI